VQLVPKVLQKVLLAQKEVAQVVGMGLGLSLLATIYPSWRAAKTDPVEALRNE
jgi:ABC-type lipoprotein release transport system permease subunit